MPVRKSEATWNGTLREGKGRLKTDTGTCDGPYTFSSRFEEGAGSNPEELIGAAHAGCFSMYLAGELARLGGTPERVHTTARVHVERVGQGFGITSIELSTEVRVTGLEESAVREAVENSKRDCPVSRALSGGVDIRVAGVKLG